MTIILENIYNALEEGIINENKALYLVFLYNNITYPIDASDLLQLSKDKFISPSGGIGKKLFISDNTDTKLLTGTIKPKYTSDISRLIPRKLCTLLCVILPDTGMIKLPGTEDSVEITADRYLGGEGLIAYHYLIFLFMFPLVGEQNKRWEKHFTGYKYTGARLRLRSKGTARKFKNAVRKKDMGIFLYGTYLFIKSCIIGKKTYVKTIRNYLSEYEQWYDEASEIIENTSNIKELFANVVAKDDRLNVVV